MMAPGSRRSLPSHSIGGLATGGWTDRPGITRVEALFLVVTLGLLLLVVLAALPRQRENARMASCRRNLMQIGKALALYDRAEGGLPRVPALESPGAGDSPLRALSLQQPDFIMLEPNGQLPKSRPGGAAGERFVPGFVCPSDSNATAGPFPAPISYRATTGDQPEGKNGGFAPGRLIALADIENGDGLAFTAAFAERRTGDGRKATPAPSNYARLPGPLDRDGCATATAAQWQGDAGSSWVRAGWASTLYNHALPPDGQPSCIGGDGRAAFMGASSGHVQGVNVLNFDGSVRTVRSTIAPPIWKALATTSSQDTK